MELRVDPMAGHVSGWQMSQAKPSGVARRQATAVSTTPEGRGVPEPARVDRGRFQREPGSLEAVLAVVEVVSPSTVSIDRAVKPVMYAEAGIPVYWRVELQGMPKVVACSLSRGRYVTRTTLVAGTRGRIARPFAVELDPAELTRRTA